MSNLIEYIKQTKKENNFEIEGISVFVDLENTNKLNYRMVIEKMVSSLPRHLYKGLEKIIISPHEKLQKRDLQGMYKNKNIYLTGLQPNEPEILDDLIHEVSHYVEEIYKEQIYSDGKIKEEFLRKRKNLKNLLKRSGYDVRAYNFQNEKYNVEFDQYLYLKVGYKNLGVISSNIFYSPYAATSLKEYFANGFEAFYMREEVNKLKKISPILYKKIVFLNNGGEKDV